MASDRPVCTRSARVITDLVLGVDPRTRGMMPGWDLELAHQKAVFLTGPRLFEPCVQEVLTRLERTFPAAARDTRAKIASFVLGLADSLSSVVELRHNLQNRVLHGSVGILTDEEVGRLRQALVARLEEWERLDGEAVTLSLRRIKLEDTAANRGDNLFAGWSREWQSRTGRDPYGCVKDFLSCFAELYAPGMYYPALFLAREAGLTSTQFFNDYGMQAARCRKVGSLGGTTNPVIAIMGEDDLYGAGNIWGQEATDYIRSFPNKWEAVRREIAAEQVARGEADDWAATRFTEWVVVDAMLGLRSVFLLTGLGRVAFQLRPDWHADEKRLTYAGGELYDILGRRVRSFDQILLDGAEELYASVAGPRVGKPNNHFKVACTGQAALNVIRSFNAGFSASFPDALKERMFTNVTLSYEVPQMVAASLAIEEGIRDYERRTGETVNDGQGGSVVTSMMGRFNDAVRAYRVERLLERLPEGHELKSLKPSSVRSLVGSPLDRPDVIAALRDAGEAFDPAAEEDAIDHAATLLTKRVVLLLENRYGLKRTRILTASKRKFHQNTDLLDVPFSTDFGNIQRAFVEHWRKGELDVSKLRWRSLRDQMNPDGTPVAGSIWAERDAVMRRIWPDWRRVWEPDGVQADEYERMIYVSPTLQQFIGFWNENVARARKVREQVESQRS